jgi:Flp pilus assembly protein TadG
VSIIMLWGKVRKFFQQRNTKPKSRDQGQSLVEFALTLPLVLLIILGTIDLGIGFKTYIALTNAAREGVRWVSIYPSDPAGALDRVKSEANRIGVSYGTIGTDGYSMTISPQKTHYSAGDKVTVHIEYDYELLFGALTGLPSVPFEASATMVVLYDE